MIDMNIFSDLMITALYTAFFQNLVLSFAYGSSEAVRISLKPRTFGMFTAMISGFSVISGAICLPIDRLPSVMALPDSVHALVYAGVLAAVYITAAVILKTIFRVSDHFLTNLGIAALNTLVLAIPFINRRSAYSFAASLGSGLGAGVAFVVAAALLASGVHRMSENKEIPQVFKGTPVLFLYISLLSLGFAAFSGNSIFS